MFICKLGTVATSIPACEWVVGSYVILWWPHCCPLVASLCCHLMPTLPGGYSMPYCLEQVVFVTA